MTNKQKRIYISWVISTLYLVLLTGLYSFSKKRSETVHGIAVDQQQVIDSCIRLIQEGDILVRSGNDFISTALAQFNTIDKSYSHCGIAIKDSIGKLMVMHSIGGEDNPDQKLKLDPLNIWIDPKHIDGFGVVRYNMTVEELNAVRAKAIEQYALPVRFDMDFDLGTDDRMYCSEFVYKTYLSVLKDPNLYKIDTIYGKPIIGVDDLFINTKARFVCKVRF